MIQKHWCLLSVRAHLKWPVAKCKTVCPVVRQYKFDILLGNHGYCFSRLMRKGAFQSSVLNRASLVVLGNISAHRKGSLDIYKGTISGERYMF